MRASYRLLAGSSLLALALACGCSKSQVRASPESQGGTTTSTAAGGAGGSAPQCTGAFCSDQSNCGAQGHSCLGGACTSGLCQPRNLAPNTYIARELALDGSNVYAALNSPELGGSNCWTPARIVSYSRASGDQTTLVTCDAVAGHGADAYAMALGAGIIYYDTINDPFETTLEQVYQVSIQGGAVQPVAGLTNGAQVFAADDTAIYYAWSGVSRVSVDGTMTVQLATQFALGM